MTEEIKGMLDKLKESAIWYEESKQLLNYITNLQKENTDLKKLCDKYEEEHKTTFETWKKVIVRNEKAIEYIKENLFEENNGCGCEWQQFPNYEDAKTRLLSTLQGGDE